MQASSYVRCVESMSLRMSPSEAGCLMSDAWSNVEHMYREAYRRAWGCGEIGYDKGGVIGVTRYLAHGGGHLMVSTHY